MEIRRFPIIYLSGIKRQPQVLSLTVFLKKIIICDPPCQIEVLLENVHVKQIQIEQNQGGGGGDDASSICQLNILAKL